MVVYIVTQLLLMTLVLQATEDDKEWETHTTTKPDSSELFGEFCLHIPDDSPWTSSKPATQLPTKPAHPTKPAPTQPTPPNRESVQPPEQTTEPDLQPIVNDDYIEPVRMASFLANVPLSHLGPDGCFCNEENMKKPTETTRVRSSTKWYPSESCSSTQYIETLEDGRQVCVIPFSALAYVEALLRYLSKPATTAPPTTEPPQDPTTTTPPTTTKPLCQPCNSFMENKDIIDSKAVRSLEVKRHNKCPLQIYINLNDDKVFCSDLSHFKTVLQKLEISYVPEELFESTPVVDGCRCQEKEKKLPGDIFEVANRRIWPRSENCSSTEIIETLMDGREVCVNVLGPYDYLEALPREQLVRLREKVYSHVAAKSSEVAVSCIGCYFPNWESINPEDVKFLKIDVLSPECPVMVFIHMANGERFCVDSSQGFFRDLMEKLEI